MAGRDETFEPIHDHGDAAGRRDEFAIVARMRKIDRNVDGPGTFQLGIRGAQVRLEDELFVIFQVNEERIITKTGELAAKEADIFARGPGVNDFGRTSVWKNALPIAVDPVETMHGITLFPKRGAAV